MRCLDVGTMDGFWAFELEARGAAEVVATDVEGNPRTPNFDVARRARRSRATFRPRDVYDLTPAEDGLFDLVFVGYVLQMVRDPLRALEAVRGVCRGSAIVLDTVSVPLCAIPAPLARLDARRDGSELFVFNRRGLRKAVELAGFEVEAATGILQDGYGEAGAGRRAPLRSLLLARLGLRGRSAAVRARPLP